MASALENIGSAVDSIAGLIKKGAETYDSVMGQKTTKVPSNTTTATPTAAPAGGVAGQGLGGLSPAILIGGGLLLFLLLRK